MFITKSIKNKSFKILIIINFTVIYHNETIEIKKFKIYIKNRIQFRIYITQCEMYIKFNVNKFKNNIQKIL